MRDKNRPLSPFITIYKNPVTSYISMGHRMSGVALSFGMVLLVIWLVMLGAGQESYECAMSIVTSIPGQIVMFGFSFVFFYYWATAVRHLIWDLGYGLEMETAEFTGYLSIAVSVVLTLLLWAVILFV